MRGSVYYQSAQLTKVIFFEGAKKSDRINPNHEHFGKVASYKSMESYRNIWNNFLHYLREHWKLKDPIKITGDHVASYMEYKVEYYPSRQYLEKICSAMGKLERALYLYTKENFVTPIEYDFSIRLKVLKTAKQMEKIADNYHNRAYDSPLDLIDALKYENHKLAALMQYEGGARYEGIGIIKREQLLGISYDNIADKKVGQILTKEKGGKEGIVQINVSTYNKLKFNIDKNGNFKIDRQQYLKDIREACVELNIIADGSHGLRWNFAQRRLFEYAKAGFTYEQSLLKVSSEMKHNRANITEHYIG